MHSIRGVSGTITQGIAVSLMTRYILETKTPIDPFESPARELPVLNRSVFYHQEDVFRHIGISGKSLFISSLEEVIPSPVPALIYRDDTYFNEELILEFINQAHSISKPARLAFLDKDPCMSSHACLPQPTLEHHGDLFLAEFYYVPPGKRTRDFTSVIVDTESIPLPCFSLPRVEQYSSKPFLNFPLASGHVSFPPLQIHVPRLSYIAIKHWTQLLFANFIWGIHRQARMPQLENESSIMQRNKTPRFGKQRGPISIGKNCQIDPTATILGPTTIGDGVAIGPNVTVAAACIGNDAILEPNCTVWLGVLGERSSLLTNRSIVMSCVMNDSIINTDVRFSIVGNHSFLASGSHFSDRLLSYADEGDVEMNAPMVKVLVGEQVVNSGYYILGPAIGNRVRIGAGVIIYPGRMIKSNSLILPERGQYVVSK
jgi:acetyltransferase-like isoleucine patch superfamily enzyme